MSFLCVLRQKEKLVKALNVFADRVILPPRSSSVKLETAEITLQVSWKLQKKMPKPRNICKKTLVQKSAISFT